MRIKITLVGIITAVLMILGSGVLIAEERDVDIIIFKSGIELPDFAEGKQELKCQILDNNDKEITADVSAYSGIQMVKKIPKSIVQEVKISDRSGDEYRRVKDKIKLPQNSKEAAYYDAVIGNIIQPLTERFTNTEMAKSLVTARLQLEKEKKLVQLGWLRVGKNWYTPEEAKGYADQQDVLQFLTYLKEVQSETWRDDHKSLSGLAERANKYKNNLYFPYILDGLQIVLRPVKGNMPPDLSILSRTSSGRLQEQANKFQKYQEKIDEIRTQQLMGLDMFVPLMVDLLSVARGWPELEQLQNFPLRDARVVLDNMWVDALQPEKTDGLLMQMADHMKNLADSGMMSAAKAQELKFETTEIMDFKNNLQRLKQQQAYNELAELKEPVRIANFAPAHKLFISTIDDANSKVNKANEQLTGSINAYQAGESNLAAEKLVNSIKIWPDNPKVSSYFNQLTLDFNQALSKKNKESAGKAFLVLNAGWPTSQQVIQFEQDLNYSKTFLDQFDTFSYTFIGIAIVCVIVGLISLKFMGKLFSD